MKGGEGRVQENLPGIRILRVSKTLGKGSYSPETGARLRETAPEVGIEIKNPGGLPIAEAAKQLGLHSGRF